MTEKEMFLNSYEREYTITCAFLDAFPIGNGDFQPHANLQSALELAWMFPEEERMLIAGALDGDVVFKKNPEPKTLEKIKDAYQDIHRMLLNRLKEFPEKDLNEMIIFGSGADNAISMRRGDALWLAIMDSVHHRGQFSVYIRMVGGKVPSLYDAYADPMMK